MTARMWWLWYALAACAGLAGGWYAWSSYREDQIRAAFAKASTSPPQYDLSPRAGTHKRLGRARKLEFSRLGSDLDSSNVSARFRRVATGDESNNARYGAASARRRKRPLVASASAELPDTPMNRRRFSDMDDVFGSKNRTERLNATFSGAPNGERQATTARGAFANGSGSLSASFTATTEASAPRARRRRASAKEDSAAVIPTKRLLMSSSRQPAHAAAERRRRRAASGSRVTSTSKRLRPAASSGTLATMAAISNQKRPKVLPDDDLSRATPAPSIRVAVKRKATAGGNAASKRGKVDRAAIASIDARPVSRRVTRSSARMAAAASARSGKKRQSAKPTAAPPAVRRSARLAAKGKNAQSVGGEMTNASRQGGDKAMKPIEIHMTNSGRVGLDLEPQSTSGEWRMEQEESDAESADLANEELRREMQAEEDMVEELLRAEKVKKPSPTKLVKEGAPTGSVPVERLTSLFDGDAKKGADGTKAKTNAKTTPLSDLFGDSAGDGAATAAATASLQGKAGANGKKGKAASAGADDLFGGDGGGADDLFGGSSAEPKKVASKKADAKTASAGADDLFGGDGGGADDLFGGSSAEPKKVASKNADAKTASAGADDLFGGDGGGADDLFGGSSGVVVKNKSKTGVGAISSSPFGFDTPAGDVAKQKPSETKADAAQTLVGLGGGGSDPFGFDAGADAGSKGNPGTDSDPFGNGNGGSAAEPDLFGGGGGGGGNGGAASDPFGAGGNGGNGGNDGAASDPFGAGGGGGNGGAASDPFGSGGGGGGGGGSDPFSGGAGASNDPFGSGGGGGGGGG